MHLFASFQGVCLQLRQFSILLSCLPHTSLLPRPEVFRVFCGGLGPAWARGTDSQVGQYYLRPCQKLASLPPTGHYVEHRVLFLATVCTSSCGFLSQP